MEVKIAIGMLLHCTLYKDISCSFCIGRHKFKMNVHICSMPVCAGHTPGVGPTPAGSKWPQMSEPSLLSSLFLILKLSLLQNMDLHT